VILVDTSVWIEILSGRLGLGASDAQIEAFVTCGPVVQEVLQGIHPVALRRFREQFDGIPRLCDPLPERIFVLAAEIYRVGRQNGYTIRSSKDCLIAAVAIECGAPVWHRDRDFQYIAGYTELRQWQHNAATGFGA
jgi:predicted nucleic acid-binding protein